MSHEPRKSLTDCNVFLSYFKALIIGLAQGIKPTHCSHMLYQLS